MFRLPTLGVTLVLSALAALAAARQEPKPGNAWYEDEVDLGFRVKAPKDWGFTPGTPLDVNVIGKYAPNNGEGVGLGGDAGVFINVWLLRFDRRKASGEEKGDKKERGGAKDIHAWMSGGIDKGSAWMLSKGYPKPLKGPKVPAECFVFEGQSTEAIGAYAGAQTNAKSRPVQCYAAVFRLQDDVEVAVVGIGPGEKKWRSYEKAFESLAKSFEPAEVASLAKGPAGPGPRNQKRAKLQDEMARTPGWKMYETESYFVVSNCTDLPFLEELQERIEAIRKVFLVDYPPDRARLVASSKEKPPPEAAEGKPEEGKQAETPDPTRTVALVNPLEASRSSVVRVCSNQEQYIQYGGRPGAPGYWNSAAEELVLFDDKAGGGRADTWVVLNHEAFHQYIYYFYGSIAPHSWYNEGTGDFYSGYMYERKRFELTENPWRIRSIQEMLRQGVADPEKRDFGYAPLPELVSWTQPQYYGENKYELLGHKVYAQGWSLIYFLRTGEKNKAKGWNPAWGSILGRYLETLANTGDLKKAVDEAFKDVDWAALDESWKAYIL